MHTTNPERTLISSYRSVRFFDGCNAVVTCQIKLFQNYFSLRRRSTEIILFQRIKTLKLLQNYFRSLLQLMNIFQHVQCR